MAPPSRGQIPSADIVSRYSLAGVRAATTAPQEALIDRAVAVLKADERVLAAYLVGGNAVGLGDSFSDVDVQCVVSDDAVPELQESWPELVGRIAPTVSIQPFKWAPGGICITPDWVHFDIVFHPASKVDPKTVEGMVPLLDKVGLLPDHPLPRPEGRGDPFFPAATVDFFLYMLGNVVAAVGRNEPIPLGNGVIVMRDIGLVALLLAEQGLTSVPPGRKPFAGNPFPFTKRLRPYLTDEQKALLAALPPLAPTVDSAIEGFVALAKAFLPRARRLAERTGARWPAEFERASVSYFERSLGASLND